jgi:hypothetical protein
MINFGEYGDGTLNRLDRLDREAAAREEAEQVKRDKSQEWWRRRRHTFTAEDMFPGFCVHCGRNGDDCGWAE